MLGGLQAETVATMQVNVLALCRIAIETLTWISGYPSCTRGGGGSLDLASEEHGGSGKGECNNGSEHLCEEVSVSLVVVVMWFELGLSAGY